MEATEVVKAEFRRLLTARCRRLGLTKAAIEHLVDHIDRPIVRRAGSRLASTDDCADYVRVLIQGAAKVVCEHGGYPPMTLQFLGPGDFLCVAAPEPHLRCRILVEAHTDVTLVSVTRAHVLAAMRLMHVRDLGQLTSWAHMGPQQTLYRKVLLLRLSVSDRIVIELASLVPRFGQRIDEGHLIDLRLTQRDVANLVVASRSNVCRALGGLAEDDVIDRRHGRYLLRRMGGSTPAASARTDRPEHQAIDDAPRHVRRPARRGTGAPALWRGA